MLKLQAKRQLDHRLCDYKFPLPISTSFIEAHSSQALSSTTYISVIVLTYCYMIVAKVGGMHNYNNRHTSSHFYTKVAIDSCTNVASVCCVSL